MIGRLHGFYGDLLIKFINQGVLLYDKSKVYTKIFRLGAFAVIAVITKCFRFCSIFVVGSG